MSFIRAGAVSDAMLQLADNEEMDSEVAVLEQERQGTEQVLVSPTLMNSLSRDAEVDKVLSGHVDQVRELLHVLFPPHRRVCVCFVLLVTKRDRWSQPHQGRVMCEHY